MAYNFKIVIVGASMAGLSLSHCLRRAKIDHVILERNCEIAPPTGAGLAIAPNGARILDQLGIWQKLEDTTAECLQFKAVSMTGKQLFASDATQLLKERSECLPKSSVHLLMSFRLGYNQRFINRRDMQKILYDALEDKSHIHLNTQVESVVHLDSGIIVKCSNGTEYTGDIVVGADGIRSKVRDEMHRHMAQSGYGNLIEKDQHSTYLT